MTLQFARHALDNQSAAPERIFALLDNFQRIMNISPLEASVTWSSGVSSLEDSVAWPSGVFSVRRGLQLVGYLAQESHEEPFYGPTQRLQRPHRRLAPSEPISWLLDDSPQNVSSTAPFGKDDAPPKSIPSENPSRLLLCRVISTEHVANGITVHGDRVCSQSTGEISTGLTPNSSNDTEPLPLEQRKHTSGEEEPQDQPSDAAGPKTNRKKRRVSTELPHLYVCPWYRYDPNASHFRVDGRFEKCRTQGIKTDKLKEHVRRVHTKPAQCPKCGRRGDPGEIRFHIDKINCTSKEDIVKPDDETLRKESTLTKQRNITWHMVFAILFPGHTPAPPEGAQYFVDESETVEQADACPDHLLQVLAAHLESTATVLETLLNSSEYRVVISNNYRSSEPAAPNVVAAATRLREIISSVPFVPDSPSGASQPATGTSFLFPYDSRSDTLDFESLFGDHLGAIDEVSLSFANSV